MKYEWKLIRGKIIKDLASPTYAGHKFFTEPDLPGKIAVGDHSGDYPHETDDGVLWIENKDEDGAAVHANHAGATVTVIDNEGKHSHISLSTADALWLVNEQGYPLVLEN